MFLKLFHLALQLCHSFTKNTENLHVFPFQYKHNDIQGCTSINLLTTSFKICRITKQLLLTLYCEKFQMVRHLKRKSTKRMGGPSTTSTMKEWQCWKEETVRRCQERLLSSPCTVAVQLIVLCLQDKKVEKLQFKWLHPGKQPVKFSFPKSIKLLINCSYKFWVTRKPKPSVFITTGRQSHSTSNRCNPNTAWSQELLGANRVGRKRAA